MPRAPKEAAYVPRYVHIREEIIRRIEEGALLPGDRAPSLREMGREFSVSSITARRALLDLLNEGLVERRGGLGAFVTGARRRVRIAVVFVGYAEAAWRQNSGSFGQLVGGIASAAWERDAALSVIPISDANVAAQSIKRLVREPLDGLILRIAGSVDTALLDLPALPTPPTVLVKRSPPGGGMPAVLPDARQAGMLSVEHLVELGHTRIGLVSSTAPIDTYRDHKAGFLTALGQHGIRVSRELVAEVPTVITGLGKAAAEQLLDLPEPPTAVVTNADFLALGVYAAAEDRHLSIPGDLSVVSFDDLEFAAHLRPPLTTVHLSYYDLGRAAAVALFRILDGEEVPPVQETPVELVVRASTAAVVSPRSVGASKTKSAIPVAAT